MPSLPTVLTSPTRAMPVETMRKMMRAITIRISLMNPLASGLKAVPRFGQAKPTRTPRTTATSIWKPSVR